MCHVHGCRALLGRLLAGSTHGSRAVDSPQVTEMGQKRWRKGAGRILLLLLRLR